MAPPDTSCFTLDGVLAAQQRSNQRYHEFLRRASLSVGVYVLPANSADPQQPHSEDEVYVIMGGQGRIMLGDDDEPVAAGSVVFVAAGVDHRFHSISEELRVLVFFAPAEGSQAR